MLISLTEAWKAVNLERHSLEGAKIMDSSLLLLEKGVLLDDSLMNRLLNKIIQIDKSFLGSSQFLYSSKSTFEGKYPDVAFNRGETTPRNFSYFHNVEMNYSTKLYFSLPWVSSDIEMDMYCLRINEYLKSNASFENYDNGDSNEIVNLLLRDGRKIAAHKSILSATSGKLAAAIEFEEILKRGTKSIENVEITVDIDFDVLRLLLEHCYNGSILSGLPFDRHNCCMILLRLAKVSYFFKV